MYTFFILLSFLVPFAMVCIHSKKRIFHIIFDIVAIAAFIFAKNLAAFSIYHTMEDQSVFTTTIHDIF